LLSIIAIPDFTVCPIVNLCDIFRAYTISNILCIILYSLTSLVGSSGELPDTV